MSGHRPFSDLMKHWTPERGARSDVRQAELAAELVSLEQSSGGLRDQLQSALPLRGSGSETN
jgi:hypothetical protein